MGRYLLLALGGLMIVFSTTAVVLDKSRISKAEKNSHTLAVNLARNAATSGAHMAVSKMSLDDNWKQGISRVPVGGALAHVIVQDQFSNSSLSAGEKMIVSVGTFQDVSETTKVTLQTPPDLGKYAVYATKEVENLQVYNEYGFKDESLLIEDAGKLPSIDWDALETLALGQEKVHGTGTHIIAGYGQGGNDEQEKDPVPFAESGGQVVTQEETQVTLKVLGSAIQSGSREIAVSVMVKLSYPDGSSEELSLFGGRDVDGGEEWSKTVPSGTSMIVRGKAHYGRGVSYWSTNTKQVICVQDGEIAPVFAPMGNQPPIEAFLTSILDGKSGQVNIEDNQLLYLYELGTTNPHSAAWDMQDLVILMTGTATAKDDQIANNDKGSKYDDDDDEDHGKSKKSKYDDDDDEDHGKSKKSKYDDDDDEDHGKSKKSKYDDDDDEDHGKSKKSKYDDDDDEDHGKSKKSKYDDDDDEDHEKSEKSKYDDDDDEDHGKSKKSKYDDDDDEDHEKSEKDDEDGYSHGGKKTLPDDFYFKDKVPNVTVVYGDLKISGNTTIYGIYIVHGNVIMDGNVHVEGVICQPDTGSSVIMHGGGNPKIMNVTGGMVVDANIKATGNHVSVKYKPEYMSIFAGYQKKSGIMITRWWESSAI